MDMIEVDKVYTYYKKRFILCPSKEEFVRTLLSNYGTEECLEVLLNLMPLFVDDNDDLRDLRTTRGVERLTEISRIVCQAGVCKSTERFLKFFQPDCCPKEKRRILKRMFVILNSAIVDKGFNEEDPKDKDEPQCSGSHIKIDDNVKNLLGEIITQVESREEAEASTSVQVPEPEPARPSRCVTM